MICSSSKAEDPFSPLGLMDIYVFWYSITSLWSGKGKNQGEAVLFRAHFIVVEWTYECGEN